jgi:hypothetical protein
MYQAQAGGKLDSEPLNDESADNPTASLKFFSCLELDLSHDDHTVLDHYGWESRLHGRWGQTRGMGLR